MPHNNLPLNNLPPHFQSPDHQSPDHQSPDDQSQKPPQNHADSSEVTVATEPTLRGPSETGELLESEKSLAVLLPERFQVIKVLGRGSFGVVFQARDARLARDVALKVLRPEWNAHPTVKARFLQESRAAARLNHAAIVRVLEADEYEGIAWQVCDVIEGTSLSRLIAKGTLDQNTIVRFMADLADAIDNAHRNGIVHRDIKPDNILVRLGHNKDMSDATVHLTDFGLAKVLDDQGYETREGFVVGTPKYLAPELMESNLRCDYKYADIYSLGVVLFECLTGKNPFFAASNMFQRARQETKRVVSIRDVSNSFPKDLDAVCKKAMAFYPDQRYATAGKFAEDLKAWARGLPTEARPLGSLERLVRFAKESPLITSLYLLLLLCLLTIAVVQLRANSLIRSQQAELKQANRGLVLGIEQAERLRSEAEDQETRYKDLAWQSGLREAYHAWGDGTYSVARQRLDQLRNSYPDFQTRPEWQLLDLEMRSRIDVVSIAKSSVEEVRSVPATGDIVAITKDGELLKVDPMNQLTKLYDTENEYELFSLASHPTEAKVYFGGTTEDIPTYDLSNVKQLDLTSGELKILKPTFFTTLEAIELNADGSQVIAASRYENPILMSGDGVTSKELAGDRHNRWLGHVVLDGEYFVYQRGVTSIELVKLGDDVQQNRSTEVKFDPADFSNTILFAGALTHSPFLAIAFTDFRGIIIVDCRTWKVVQFLQRDVTTNVSSFASNFNGSMVAIGLESGEVIVWDVQHQPWWREYQASKEMSTSVEFPESIDVHIGSAGFMTEGPLSPVGNWSASNAPIQSLTFSGSLLFGGTKAGELLRVNLAGLVNASKPDKGIETDTAPFVVESAIWAEESGDLFVESAHGTWFRWTKDTIDKALLKTSLTAQGPFIVDEPASSPSERIGIRDLRLNELMDKATLIRSFTAGFGPLDVRVSANGKVAAWFEKSNELTLWREESKGTPEKIPLTEKMNSVTAVSPLGDYVVLRGEHHRYYLLKLTNKEPEVSGIDLPGSVSHIAWHPTNKKFLMGGDMGSIIEYDYDTNRANDILKVGSFVSDIAYFDDGQSFVSVHGDGTVRLKNLLTNESKTLSVHRDLVSSMVIDRRGRLGMSVDRFGSMSIWFMNPADVIGSLRNGTRTKQRASFRGPSLWISKSGLQIAATIYEPDGVLLRFWNY
jgi:serine/threonine protein kinase/WD40 repeat protein